VSTALPSSRTVRRCCYSSTNGVGGCGRVSVTVMIQSSAAQQQLQRHVRFVVENWPDRQLSTRSCALGTVCVDGLLCNNAGTAKYRTAFTLVGPAARCHLLLMSLGFVSCRKTRSTWAGTAGWHSMLSKTGTSY
jgi:hypothetical protein